MPTVANQGFEAARFAALWAGLDAGNSNEAEAVSKFRALRRMAVGENVRIIDLMGRADVLAALDAQLKPVREESPELKDAFGKITQLADDLAREKEISEELREQVDDLLATVNEVASTPVIPPQAWPRPGRGASDGLVNAGLVAAVSIVAVALMIASAFQ